MKDLADYIANAFGLQGELFYLTAATCSFISLSAMDQKEWFPSIHKEENERLTSRDYLYRDFQKVYYIILL